MTLLFVVSFTIIIPSCILGIIYSISLAVNDSHYKYKMYLTTNATLVPSNFIYDCRYIATKITKFRLGSYSLPMETGRWCQKLRKQTLCPSCQVFGKEFHIVYICSDINDTGLRLPATFAELWKCDDLFQRIGSSCDYI